MGGSRSGHASVGSRTRSSARRGSRGRTGRGGAGRGRKRPRRDYETRRAESPAHSSARDRGGAALRCAVQGRGRGLGSPRGPPPCRANRGRWALEEGLAPTLGPSGTARSLCAPAVAGQKGSGAPAPCGPNRVQRFAEAHPETKTLVCKDGRFSGENYKEMWRPGQQKARSKDMGPAVAHPIPWAAVDHECTAKRFPLEQAGHQKSWSVATGAFHGKAASISEGNS